MNLKKFVEKRFKAFANSEGSEYIASEYALYQILKMVKIYRPKRILEVGVGIGTISSTVLDLNKERVLEMEVFGTEANDFCVEQIEKNIMPKENFFLYKDLSQLPDQLKFDFIIVDGAEDRLKSLKERINPSAIIVVEGDRQDQTETIKEIFPNSLFVHSVSGRKNRYNPHWSEKHYQNGLKVLFVNPQIRHYLTWLKLKLKSKYTYLFLRG